MDKTIHYNQVAKGSWLTQNEANANGNADRMSSTKANIKRPNFSYCESI